MNWIEVAVWPMAGLNLTLAAINTFYLWRMLRTRHDERTYDVVEVRPDDAYLAHVLRVHQDDIARTNPCFGFDPEAAHFARRGGRRVLTPAGMKNPYYGRIGFRAEGDRWVLDLEPARS